MSAQDGEQLTLFQEDSLASLFPWLESKKAGKMSAIYGLKCSELSEKLRRVGLSVRMYLESCELPPGTWQRIWSARAITSRCLILKLRLLEQNTEGNGSRLWQTPTVPNGGRKISDDMTPTGRTPDGKKRTVGLENQVKMVERNIWPTPTASDAEHGGGYYKRGNPHLTTCAREDGNIGQLNPEWVEWLMGYPIGWTELDA